LNVPLALDDPSLDELMNLAAPLDVELRDPFLRAVAAELTKHPAEALGAGLVARVARPLQREFLRAPPTSGRIEGKYA
jgi:hypothetical protein